MLPIQNSSKRAFLFPSSFFLFCALLCLRYAHIWPDRLGIPPSPGRASRPVIPRRQQTLSAWKHSYSCKLVYHLSRKWISEQSPSLSRNTQMTYDHETSDKIWHTPKKNPETAHRADFQLLWSRKFSQAAIFGLLSKLYTDLICILFPNVFTRLGYSVTAWMLFHRKIVSFPSPRTLYSTR